MAKPQIFRKSINTKRFDSSDKSQMINTSYSNEKNGDY